MSPLTLLDHLANFALPALFVAGVLGLGGRFIMGQGGVLPLWKQVAINFAAGRRCSPAGWPTSAATG